MPVHPATFPQFTVDMMSLRKYRLTGPSAGASAHLLVGTSPEHTLRYPTTTLGAEILQHPHPIIGEPSECDPKNQGSREPGTRRSYLCSCSCSCSDARRPCSYSYSYSYNKYVAPRISIFNVLDPAQQGRNSYKKTIVRYKTSKNETRTNQNRRLIREIAPQGR